MRAVIDTDLAAAWAAVHDATPPGRFVGRSGFGNLALLIVAAALIASACVGLSRTYPLPTADWSGVCGGLGINANLRGDPLDPELTWLEPRPGFTSDEPARHHVVWPAGFTARFSPGLEIVDEAGQVVMREGDPVTGICGADFLSPDVIYGISIDCGPVEPRLCSRRMAFVVKELKSQPDLEVNKIHFPSTDGASQLILVDDTIVTGPSGLP